jgi:hypothetical protein
MNTARKFLVSAVSMILLSACSTTGLTTRFEPRRESVQDYEYIARIESSAMKAPERVDVIWVNPPEIGEAGATDE